MIGIEVKHHGTKTFLLEMSKFFHDFYVLKHSLRKCYFKHLRVKKFQLQYV